MNFLASIKSIFDRNLAQSLLQVVNSGIEMVKLLVAVCQSKVHPINYSIRISVLGNHFQALLEKYYRLPITQVFHQNDCGIVEAADPLLLANVASEQIASTGLHALVHEEKVIAQFKVHI